MQIRRWAHQISFLALSAIIALTVTASWGADDKDQTDIEKRIDASATVLNEIMATRQSHS